MRKLAALALFLPAAAAAQEPPLRLTITQGQRIASLPRSQAALRAIPGAASVIESSQWQNTRAATVKDMVDYTPGVFAQPRNGAESARLSIRGSGLNRTFQGRGLLVMQDGIPINTADGSFEFQSIDPWLIRYAEVFRGANALEYGASNFGGAINLLTPSGEDAPGMQWRGEGGSFGHARAMAAAGRAWQGGDLHAAVSGFQQEGFRNHNTQDTLRFSGNLGLRGGAGEQRVTLSHTATAAQIPGAVSKAELTRDSRTANPANTAGRYARALDITRLGWRGAWQSDAQEVEAALFYSARELENPVTVFIDSGTQDVGARGRLSRRLGDTRLTFGSNIYYGADNEHRFANLSGQRGAPVVNREMQALTAEAYTQLEQPLTQTLHVIGSLQASHARRGIRQSFPTRAGQQENYTGVNPRIGLRRDLPQGELFANLSRSFEPPTLSELSGGNSPGFTRLAAQRATTAELGARLREGIWQCEAAYYHGWLQNEFVTTSYPDGVTKTFNARHTTRDGVELGLAGDLAERVALRGAYSWSRFRLRNDPLYAGHALPGMPAHYLRAALRFHTASISLEPNVEWVPRAYSVDLADTLRTSPYAIFGLQAAWQPLTGLNLYLDARNLLNRRYAATTNLLPNAAGADGRYFYPGEGRAFYAGLRLGW